MKYGRHLAPTLGVDFRGITLRVEDLAAVRDFYAETLALDITAEEDRMIAFDVGGRMLCLDSRARGGGSGTGGRQEWSLWFTVDGFASVVERLKAAGAVLVRGPEKSTGNGKWFVVVRDPAGREVRLDEK